VIERAVDYLGQAKHICFFGMGASGAAAQDALNKFFGLIFRLWRIRTLS
jgi:RpiR family carbohydrate utilization transcriptional regulator